MQIYIFLHFVYIISHFALIAFINSMQELKRGDNKISKVSHRKDGPQTNLVVQSNTMLHNRSMAPTFSVQHSFDSINPSDDQRVRILPGSRLPSNAPPPPPPSSPPLKPSHLCKIAVVGDAYAGKSALVRRFIDRRYASDSSLAPSAVPITPKGGDGGEAQCLDGGVSLASSIGTSFGPSITTLEPTLAEYHKKDVTIYDTNNETEEGKEKSVCIRVQVWDMNLQQNSPRDDISSAISIHSASSSPRYNMNSIGPLLPLLKRIHGVIIACRCPLPPSSFLHSSAASVASHASNTSNMTSAWPELDLLEHSIDRWVHFLRDNVFNQQKQSETKHQSEEEPCLFVLLNQADQVVTEFSPNEWMKLSARMQTICSRHGIVSWKLGSCMSASSFGDKRGVVNRLDSGLSIDENEGMNEFGERTLQQPTQSHGGNPQIHNLIKHEPHQHQYLLLQRMWQQQKQMLEEMEDAIETTFTEMIALYLAHSRSHNAISHNR